MKKEIDITDVIKDSLKNLFENKDLNLKFNSSQHAFNSGERREKDIIIHDLSVRPSDFSVSEIIVSVRKAILVEMDSAKFISRVIILDFIKDFDTIYEERKRTMEDKIKETKLKKELAISLNEELERIGSLSIFRYKKI